VGCDLRLSDFEKGCGREDLSDRFKEVRVMTMHNMPPVWHTGWIPPTALTAALVALIIAAVVAAARYLREPPPESGANTTVRSTVDAEKLFLQRHARGEVDAAEYERRFEMLHAKAERHAS
jgi:uncharacterized membrane protein